MVKDAALTLESHYTGKGQPLLQLRRKWLSFSKPNFSLSLTPAEATAWSCRPTNIAKPEVQMPRGRQRKIQRLKPTSCHLPEAGETAASLEPR